MSAEPAAGGAPAGGPERQTLEALKSIGKALGQMALYKVGHPAVAATIQAAREHLDAALAASGRGSLAVSLDHDQVVVNGRVVGARAALPNTVAALFQRFKLASLTFREGVSAEDLSALCELAASRGDSPAAADPGGFLAGRGVSRVALNEAVYARVDEAGAASGPGEGGGAEGAGGAGGAASGAGPGPGGDGAAESQARAVEIGRAVESGSIDRTIQVLVEKAVPDPELRRKVLSQVMELLAQDAARRVEEVTLPLRREKKAAENEQLRTQSVLQNMADGVVVVDEEGRILMMNPAAEQIYGATLAQAAGRSLAERAGDKLVVGLSAEMRLPSDRDARGEVDVAGAADTRRALRSSSALVKTEGGKVVGMLSALPDAVRHRELQRMQRDFVAHVTHELRAPLSSIRAALEIIQGQFTGRIEEDEARVLNTALKNSDRLAEMINSILDFSKLESGQMTVRPAPCEPGTVAAEAVESLQPWARKKGVALSLEAPAGLPVVSADAPRTVQVLVNLLSNALKFTPAGGSVRVSLAKRAVGAQGFVEFRVSDTGPGIPKDQQERVFEKFAQVSTGEFHPGGTGLGLAIAKALVHLQGGALALESEPGRGAAFFFSLPVRLGGEAEVLAVRPRAGASGRAPWWKKLLGLN